MRAAVPGLIAITMLLAGCSPPAQHETKAPQWGRGSNAETAPPPPAAVPQATPSVPLDTKADGQPYGAAASARPTDQTTAAQRAEMDAAAAAAGVAPTAQTRTTFACDNGETVEVRFFPEQGVAVLVRGGQNTELQGEAVASGFKYSNGQTTIRGKGDAIELNVGMMATAKCTAKA